jgi:hypothetical protein
VGFEPNYLQAKGLIFPTSFDILPTSMRQGLHHHQSGENDRDGGKLFEEVARLDTWEKRTG